ncbi:MAG: hypothetical protein WBD87_09310 [Candidatus Acidiferrales bacterium]
MKRTVLSLIAFLILYLPAHAQTPGSKVYIALPPQGTEDFGPAITAAVIKKETPVTIVTDKKAADYEIDYVLTSKNGNKGAQVAAGVLAGAWWIGEASASASFQITDLKTSTVVYSYTVHKAGEGQHQFQSAAEAFAKHWKNWIDHKGK